MKPDDFEYVSAFLKNASGLVLTPEKSYLLENRLQPVIRKHGLQTLDQLAEALRSGSHAGLDYEVVEAMTTNESFFFRDMKPFDNFRNTVLPELLQSRPATQPIRIWSAACSTGQEPYSLCIVLNEIAAQLAGRKFEILATDLSVEVLRRAKQGLYTQFEVQRGLPVQMLVKYFEKAGDKWKINAAVRDRVKFREHNLIEGTAAVGKFDIVFCRNVLIYFDAETKAKVLARLADQMPADGRLFLGGAETVLGISDRFAPVSGLRGVYRPAQAAGAGDTTGSLGAASQQAAG